MLSETPKADAHKRDDCGKQQEISPAVGADAVHEAGFAKGPPEHCAKESSRAEIEPALQKKTAVLIGNDGCFVGGVVKEP